VSGKLFETHLAHYGVSQKLTLWSLSLPLRTEKSFPLFHAKGEEHKKTLATTLSFSVSKPPSSVEIKAGGKLLFGGAP